MGLKILVRFDDLCPTMDYDEFEKALAICNKYGIKPLLGVIPDCKDEQLQIEAYHDDFWRLISELQESGFAIAMHGYQHLYDINCRGMVNTRKISEFSGHSYETQCLKIKKGKEQLERYGIKTDIFFAPAHSYDINTIRALGVNGVHFMSDGASKKAYRYDGVLCLPCRSGGVPKIKNKGFYTAIFHPNEWKLPEKKIGYENLVDLCSAYHNEIVEFEDYIQQPIGNTKIQMADEKIYVFFQRQIRPVLSKIKHKL